MKATATLAVVRCGDRDVVVDQRSEAPFSLRQCGQRILLAASAAAPVGGDELEFCVDVGPGARADVGSVAATMVWPGATGASSLTTTRCIVGSGGHLDFRLEPTISVAASRHRAVTSVQLDDGATCRVIEEVVLGRRGEPAGHLELSFRVERSGRPIIHHDEVFGPDVVGALSSVSVGAARFALTAVHVGVDAGASRVVVDGDCAAAWMPVEDDAAVAMVVGRDRPTALAALGRVGPAGL